MPKLPKKNRDLIRLVIRRGVLRLLGWLLWTALWIGGALSYNANHQTYPAYRLITGWKMFFLSLLATLTGFLIFRGWKFFTDRTCRGVIVTSGLSHSYSASSDPGKAGMDYDFRINTALKLRTDDGKVRRLRFEQKNGFYHYYHEGNRIVRFHGLPYPINLDPTAANGFVCAACGFWSEQPINRCDLCHHSMIDPKELDI